MKSIWFNFFTDEVVFCCKSCNQGITVVSEKNAGDLNNATCRKLKVK